MFEKFGEMNSSEEINLAAEGLFNEGDTENLKELAKENGIPAEMLKDYLDGKSSELCDPLTAALGKLEMECKELKPEEIMKDWVGYLENRCMESEEIARAVRSKGRNLKGCIGELLKWSFINAKAVDKEVMIAAGVSGASGS